MNNTQDEISGIGIIASYFTIQLFASILWLVISAFNQVSVDTISAASEMYYMQALAITELFYLAIVIHIYKQQIKETISEITSNITVFGKKLGLYIVIFIGLLLTSNLLNNTVFASYITDLGANEAIIQEVLASSPGLLVILSITIIGPLIEEYVFRYGLITKLLGKFNRYLAASIATVIFGFIHIGFTQIFSLNFGQTIHLFLIYMPISIVLNFVYAKEGNLAYPIIIHIINNCMAVITAITAYNIFL